MKKYDLVIFDLDGTILDTTQGVLAAVKYTIEQMNFEMLPDEQLATFIGPPIQDSFAKAYNLSGDILQNIATIFRNQYKDHDLLKATPYSGIFDVLQKLEESEIASAVATYKREDYALTLLKHYGFDKYMPIMHGADHENKLKKQDIIQICIDEAGISDKSRVIMVGDTIHDAVGAEKLGVDFIGVTYGFGFKSLEETTTVPNIGFVENPMDIIKLVTTNKD
ncbi:MAG: HAD hydrolase-like protein [Waltera sp.]|jgi:hypothetical protein